MTFNNCNIFINGHFVRGSLETESGLFSRVSVDADAEDPSLPYILPGLVDAHTHGNSGADFSDGDIEGLRKMARFYAENGITAFAPTSMTLPYEVLAPAFETARAVKEEQGKGLAKIAGIHMEGPFFSGKKKGAQNGAYLRDPDFEAFKLLYDQCGGLISIVDVAPELDGAAEFAARASRLCTVSVAHTDASYEESRAVFEAGASHLTHLFNAMPSIHHRRPGVIGAASEDPGVTAELIGDGLHVHESAMRMAFKLFPERICLVSDSLRCAGMPDGEYELGGQAVFLRGGVARLADGTIAGSASNLWQCMRNAVSFGIDRDAAIRAATCIPARELGACESFGCIAVGRHADFAVADRGLDLLETYIDGIKV